MAAGKCIVGDDGWRTVFLPESLVSRGLPEACSTAVVDMPSTGAYPRASLAVPRKFLRRAAPGVCTLRVPSDWDFRLTSGRRGETRVATLTFDQWLDEMSAVLYAPPGAEGA